MTSGSHLARIASLTIRPMEIWVFFFLRIGGISLYCMAKFSLFESVLRFIMEKLIAFLSQLLAETVSWYQQASWRDRGIAGGGLLTFILLLIWGISALGDDDFNGQQEIDEVYGAYIRAYTAGVVSTESSFRVAFNHALADSASLGEAVDEGYFSFNPEIQGTTYWLDPYTLEFIPDKRLLSGQQYQVKLALEDLVEVPDEMAYFEYSLQTMQQDFVVDILGLSYPKRDDLANPVLRGSIMTADFAEAAAIEQMLSASQDGNTLGIDWKHTRSDRKHEFVVRDIIRQSGTSEVQLTAMGETIAVGKEDNYRLEVPSLEQFTLIGHRVIEEPEQYLELRFSDPLQENQDLEGLVQLRQEDEALRYVIERNLLRVYAPNSLNGQKTVVLYEGIKNSRGESLSQPTEIDVLYEPIKPAVRFVNKGVILPSTDGLRLPFEAVNLRSVNVTVVKVFEDNLSQFFQVNQYDGELQVRRVARPVAQQRIPLNASGATDLSRWNRFTLDLAEIIEPDPGALYQVVLSFRRGQSLYQCSISQDDQPEDLTQYALAQQRENLNQLYWDSYDQYYYAADFNWQERDDPCSSSYYGFRRVASTNLLATDLGVIAKRSTEGSLQVLVNNLQSTEPVSGAEISVYDFQQQLIARTSTDGDGLVNIRTEQVPYLVVAADGDQRSYLRVDDGNALSLSNFDVSGEEVRQGIKGFIYGDRGVWRPGDSLHLNFILQDVNERLPDNHPVVFQLINPRGQTVQRIVNTEPVGDIYNFSTATQDDAITGNWTAQVAVGGATFTKNIRVETVRPNRLKVEMDFRTDPFTFRNTTPTAYLDVAWLSGATARNLRVEYELLLTATNTTFEDFPDYSFDDRARSFTAQRRKVFDGRVDQSGNASFDVNLRLEQAVPGLLNATLVGKVFEEGGNFSTDRLSLPYYPYASFVGIKLPEGEGVGGMLSTGESHTISLVAVDERGQPLNRRDVEVALYKLDWRWWWEQSDASIANYVANQYRKPVIEETVSLTRGEGNWSFTIEDEDWGRYYIRACDPVSGHCTGEVMYMDWPGYAGRDDRQAQQAAAMLSFSADKEQYQVDEEATVYIPARGEGRALVSIENGSKVLETFWVELEEEGETAFTFEITEEMTPNIYIHLSLLQPHASTANDLPIRMYGVIPLEVTDEATILAPVLSMPEKLEPESEVIITVGEANERPMAYTIAMVDEGLLDITNFSTPDPHSHFYAREALGIKTWDVYDYVIGAYGGELERILAIGGDASGELTTGKRASANRFTPVVKFLGPFFLEEDEENTHTIKMPNYVGSVRTVLIGAHKGAYGYAALSREVSKSLMVLGTLPRVLGPGEALQLPVDIFATDNSVKSVRVSVSADDPISLTGQRSAEMFFPNPGEEHINFDLKVANQTGVGKVEINAAAGPIRTDYPIEIDVRNPNPSVTETVGTLLETGNSWDTTFSSVGMPGTRRAVLELSDIPPLNLAQRMPFLINFPHGCIEQTVSAAFPQLYLSAVEELDEQEQAEIEANVKEAIRRLSAFRTNEGAFAYWPGSNDADEWSTSYAGHFLLEARQRGYFIPAGLLQGWISYQRRRATQWGRSQEYAREDLIQAYRLYTLSLSGEAETGAMNRMREMSDLHPVARWRLSGAYALIGQNQVAESMIQGLETQVAPYQETQGTYGSALRDQAMILEILGILQKRERGLTLFRSIAAELASDAWISTQSTAFALIATTKFAGGMQLSTGISARVSLNGQPLINLQSGLSVIQREIPMSGRGEQAVSVVNQGEGELYARVIREGQPAPGDEKVLVNGLRMNVVYKGINGDVINIRDLRQGTDFVAEVTVYNPGTMGNQDQLALTHVIPSGWEILNTRLLNLDAFNQQSDYDFQNIRDDRVYTYFDLGTGERKTFRMMLNASYTGRFYQPAIYCESMYDNSINAGLSGQWIEVVNP